MRGKFANRNVECEMQFERMDGKAAQKKAHCQWNLRGLETSRLSHFVYNGDNELQSGME